MDTTLPPPTISFTIPSLHDTTVLSCRVYHPDSLSASALSFGGADEEPWRGQVAVFAHPYAPLGGSADDRVVDVVAGTLVRKGYLVGTFNFRGAGDSEGRTSWTAKGEKDDYVSVVAFMLHYAHHLDPSAPHRRRGPGADPPVFLMGGYSYGAMVTTLLPPLDDLLRPFDQPKLGTAAAEICLRAEHLAELENGALAQARARAKEARSRSGTPGGGGGGSTRRSGIRVGGTESGEAIRKSSDGRRAFIAEAEEKIRRSIGDVVGRKRRSSGEGRPSRGGGGGGGSGGGGAAEGLRHLEPSGIVPPRVAYLLVSPLQGTISHLATMSFLPTRLPLPGVPKLLKMAFHHKKDSDEGAEPAEASVGEDASKGDTTTPPETLKLQRNPTLAIFGDKDVFVSASKLRTWTRRMQGAPRSRFHAVEVSTAGHFWIEEGVLDRLIGAVGGFSAGL
ncbi:uncharacterized protein DNG_08833 [Cephalotrichum gorgonifer]|uniref:Uncharacterized protein n=1 Tax=Cephalotrichum gorgonifer TaxID=2041049 RepID=A0AAE8N5S3_9PEZI|nr:uncharacterized protein DNG_08833 [Cephalotrichum gorgonifer]